jgi:hypothetical protein
VPRGFAVEAGVRRVVIFVDDEAQDQRGEFRDGHAGARLGFILSAGLWIAESTAGEPEQRTDFEGLEGSLDLGALLRRLDLGALIFDIEDVADGLGPGVKDGGAFVAGKNERVSAIFVGRFAADRLGQRRLVGHAHPQQHRGVCRAGFERQRDRRQHPRDATDCCGQDAPGLLGFRLQFGANELPQAGLDREHMEVHVPVVHFDPLHGAEEPGHAALGRMEAALGVFVEMARRVDVERRELCDPQIQEILVRNPQVRLSFEPADGVESGDLLHQIFVDDFARRALWAEKPVGVLHDQRVHLAGVALRAIATAMPAGDEPELAEFFVILDPPQEFLGAGKLDGCDEPVLGELPRFLVDIGLDLLFDSLVRGSPEFRCAVVGVQFLEFADGDLAQVDEQLLRSSEFPGRGDAGLQPGLGFLEAQAVGLEIEFLAVQERLVCFDGEREVHLVVYEGLEDVTFAVGLDALARYAADSGLVGVADMPPHRLTAARPFRQELVCATCQVSLTSCAWPRA